MHCFGALFVSSSLALAATASPAKSTLKAAASPRYFAAAIGYGHLTNKTDHLFREIAVAEYGGLTPENEMKWEITEPEQGVFNFTQAEIIVSFAEAHDYVIRGHTLVWYSQLAPWVTEIPESEVLSAMQNHITTAMTHFKGRIYAWDVVNEGFNDDGTFRDNVFLENIGEDYFEIAYQTARKADPRAKLYYNDYNTEGVNNKSDSVLSLVKSLKSKGLIDGVGFQSHFIVGSVPNDLQANLQRFVDAGVEVAITELDIRANTPVNASVIAQHAKDFAFVVNACQAVKKCVGITTWGITDSYSWIPSTFPGQGYGLLWDDSYEKKPAYYTTLTALRT
ncbi:endo-1,4-beta-xylanase [Punctularia strigosozonata HHB-11173 SS5]|uniref:endo-1,4-beta-xylanase n=1 Tax=Punctularia strigosozonata (strain HHB-11173) TaxID=741275 RepID=UPI0004416FFF|nr:endo-1,4-beta-xylanase [Punctularia strigosozonata HHB-11173 SS5]EIN13907.1 endo-1,4-beta-xylanase [Punctularia strigosozonata HHB-11173 SS5]